MARSILRPSHARSIRHLFALLLLVMPLSLGLPDVAGAQTCGTEYAIKDGETLAQIAARTYGNPAQ